MIVDVSLLFEVFFCNVDDSDEPTPLLFLPPLCLLEELVFLLLLLKLVPATCQSVQ